MPHYISLLLSYSFIVLTCAEIKDTITTTNYYIREFETTKRIPMKVKYNICCLVSRLFVLLLVRSTPKHILSFFQFVYLPWNWSNSSDNRLCHAESAFASKVLESGSNLLRVYLTNHITWSRFRFWGARPCCVHSPGSISGPVQASAWSCEECLLRQRRTLSRG